MKIFDIWKSFKGYAVVILLLLCFALVLGAVIPCERNVSVSGDAVWVSSSGTYLKEDRYVIEGKIKEYLIPLQREKQFDGTLQIGSLDYTKEYPLVRFTYGEKGYLTYMDMTAGEDGFFQTLGPIYMENFPEEAVVVESVRDGELVCIVLGASTAETANQKVQEMMR